MTMTVTKLHNILSEQIAQGPGSRRVGINLDTFNESAEDAFSADVGSASAEWINCSDRMPMRGERVVISSRYEGPVIGWLTGAHLEFWCVDGQEDLDPRSCWTHWMRLPEVPTE